jgi:hypothetical protein
MTALWRRSSWSMLESECDQRLQEQRQYGRTSPGQRFAFVQRRVHQAGASGDYAGLRGTGGRCPRRRLVFQRRPAEEYSVRARVAKGGRITAARAFRFTSGWDEEKERRDGAVAVRPRGRT